MIYDLTMPISNNTPVWEGDQPVTISMDSKISQGADFNVSRIEMSLHCGTHVDAPYHVADDGKTVDQIPLEHLVGRAQVIQVAEDVTRINADILAEAGIQKGIQRLLIKTRNSTNRRNENLPFSNEFTALDAGAADYLAAQDLKLVGIDGISIALMEDQATPHVHLLKAGIVILENVHLRDVPSGIYQLCCLPLKVVGADGAPARVILMKS